MNGSGCDGKVKKGEGGDKVRGRGWRRNKTVKKASWEGEKKMAEIIFLPSFKVTNQN